MAKLAEKTRKKMPSKEFALPGKRKYPIEDKSHARNALARASQHATPAEKKTIRRKVAKKFPGIEQNHEAHKAITEQSGHPGKRSPKKKG